MFDTWNEARANCETRGGHLLAVNSHEEWTAVFDHIMMLHHNDMAMNYIYTQIVFMAWQPDKVWDLCKLGRGIWYNDVCLYVCVCMYVCTYVCTHARTHTHKLTYIPWTFDCVAPYLHTLNSRIDLINHTHSIQKWIGFCKNPVNTIHRNWLSHCPVTKPSQANHRAAWSAVRSQ